VKKGLRGINPASKPSGDGCVECRRHRKVGGFTSAGVRSVGIGCCDSSPSQHASKRAAATGHPIVASWFSINRALSEPTSSWFVSTSLLNA
jgi:hypothetical protein